jgi:hypothetical protein
MVWKMVVPWREGGSKGRREKIDCGRAAGIRAFLRSLESDWIFCFLRFACTLRSFLWNGRNRSFVPNANPPFLSSGIISFKIPVSFQTGPYYAVNL